MLGLYAVLNGLDSCHGPGGRCSGQGRVAGHSTPIWRDFLPLSLYPSSFLPCPLKSSIQCVESPQKIKKIKVLEGLRSFQETWTGNSFLGFLSEAPTVLGSWPPSSTLRIRNAASWDFPGSTVVGTLCFHCREYGFVLW